MTTLVGFAEALADALEARGGWYADFHSDTEVTVAFSGRMFRYRRGDQSERARVKEYARSVGVPDEPLIGLSRRTYLGGASLTMLLAP